MNSSIGIGSAHRGYFAAECGQFVRENEKRVAEKKIEQETERR